MILYSGIRGARWWTAVTFVICGLVLVNNVVYFDRGPTPRFLLEKGHLAENSLWLAAFYFHVVGASVCLAVGFPLMFPSWTRRHPAWHRRLGHVYTNAVLWMAAPAGLLMAPVAKGGWWGATGFALLAALWWQTTWSGYRAIRNGNLATHVQGMVRSYSLALSAPLFRVFQALLFVCGLDDSTNYIFSLWLSIAASLWLSESFLHRNGREAIVFAYAPSTLPAGGVS
jgi:uncharacterized membrane protein